MRFVLRSLVLWLSVVFSAQGELRLPAVFSDGAVLQRGDDVRIWGWAAPGADVGLRVSWGEKEDTAQADPFGAFSFHFASPDNPGPHEIELASGDVTHTLVDLWFGEVWLCAGQSNMEMEVSAVVPPGSTRLQEAELPRLRVFDVEKAFALHPEEQCEGKWQACTPSTALRFSAVATFFGQSLLDELDVPIGLVTATWGGTIGEAWASAKALRDFPECRQDLERLALLRGVPLSRKPLWLHPNRPGVIYNAMIAPLASGSQRALSLRGVLWYQGESNRGRARRYGVLLPALIADWRRSFDAPELPFYFVQIAPFAYLRDVGEAARLRDEQRRTLRIPNTGMAVTMDIGDPGNLHPTRKIAVGQRLARWALARTYGREDVAYSGPLFKGWVREEETLRLFFEHGGGLNTEGKTLEHFTLAGRDGIRHPAQARVDGESVVVWRDGLEEPLEVWFGGGAADETSLFNAAGLPAASFIGDGRDRL